ncbi:hypothetical protein EVAR_93204_1 [Eumeta japonica]|uniref:Uncharacterized protein n=1 Tax=Eumeta variegata TaxID=151549 RepID=A0A4C1TYV4_EUMVA|nr:hypothetical protein EVAR_93204_1 [Eumeta japonica]
MSSYRVGGRRKSITAKYQLAHKEMVKHTSAVDNSIELSKYNYGRFESLTTKQCSCETPPVDYSRPECDSPAPRARAAVYANG